MKTEGQFNAYLSKEIKRYSPRVHVIKVADKFTTGISDFIIWCNGRSMGLESKFIDDLPKRKSTKIFSHPFSGAQVTFLESLNLAGSFGFGIVAIESQKKFYVIDYDRIPPGGNFTLEEWESTGKIPWNYDQVEDFIQYYFGPLR